MASTVGRGMVMHCPKPPIVLFEDLDLMVFPSIEKAEQFLEPIDVEQGDCLGYDSEGRLLQFGVIRPRSLWARMSPSGERTVLLKAESVPTHQDDLRDKLIAHLRHVGVSEMWLTQATVSDMISKALEQNK